MDKDAYYFPHFCNARQDRKIKRLRKVLGLEGYGIYFMLLEVLREQPDFKFPLQDIDLLADEFQTSKEKIESVVINFDLFATDEENFFSIKFIEYLTPYLKSKQNKKIGGIKGNLIKYGYATKEDLEGLTDEQVIEFNESKCQLVVGMRPHSNHTTSQKKGNEIKGNKKEIKVNEIENKDIMCVPAETVKEQIPYREIIEYLNIKTESSYKYTTSKTKELIKTRWNEGFTIDDFKKCIDNQTILWLKDPKMNKYLRPETLFGNKFESYVNAKIGLSDLGLISQSTEKGMSVLQNWAKKKEMEERQNEKQ